MLTESIPPPLSRPYKRFRAVPHDVWLMSQPVVFNQQHIWVSDTAVYTLPMYRVAGVYAPANGEFSTKYFAVPEGGLSGLWLNAVRDAYATLSAKVPCLPKYPLEM